MEKEYDIEKVWDEFIKRLNDECLFHICLYKDTLTTWKKIKEDWDRKNPNKSIFK